MQGRTKSSPAENCGADFLKKGKINETIWVFVYSDVYIHGAPAAATQAIVPQASPTMFFGTTTAGEVNNLPSAFLLIYNLSGEKVVYVTLTCQSPKGGTITYNVSVTKSTVLQYVVCSYTVLVQIPMKRYMSISYGQTNKDKSVMSIYLTKVVVHGP